MVTYYLLRNILQIMYYLVHANKKQDFFNRPGYIFEKCEIVRLELIRQIK